MNIGHSPKKKERRCRFANFRRVELGIFEK
jgi:hypothetical protein